MAQGKLGKSITYNKATEEHGSTFQPLYYWLSSAWFDYHGHGRLLSRRWYNNWYEHHGTGGLLPLMGPNGWCGHNGTGVLLSLKESNMFMGTKTLHVIKLLL